MYIVKENRGGGFTLIELMVTIAIMGVLLAIAVPAFAEWRATTALKSAGDTLILQLKQARHLAVGENRSVAVQVFPTQIIFDQDPNVPPVGKPYQNKVISMSQFGNVTLTTNAAGGLFSFNSRCTSNTGTITITLGTRIKTITVNRIGRAYLQ